MNYDSRIAESYQAYRPPLHTVILSKILTERYSHALDVGCGVGTSAVALTAFADHVVAIDPSKEMLEARQLHPNVEYQHCALPVPTWPSANFDLISFAGSINYCHTQQVFDEVLRLLRPSGVLIVYDFEVLTADFLGLENMQEGYDHSLNWDKLNTGKLNKEYQLNETYHFEISHDDLITLCKAEEGIMENLSKTGQGLEELMNLTSAQMSAGITGTRYQLV